MCETGDLVFSSLFKMPYIENSGYITKDRSVSGKFKWSVPNFFAFAKNSNVPCVSSPWFCFQKNKWRLVLLPSDSDWIGVFLWNKYSNNQKNEFNVSIKLESNSLIRQDSYNNYRLIVKDVITSGEDFGIQKFLRLEVFRRNFSNISPKGNMLFTCEIEIVNEDADSNEEGEDSYDEEEENSDDCDEENEFSDNEDEGNEEQEDAGASLLNDSKDKKNNSLKTKGLDTLLENFEKMFLDGQDSDVILKVQNEEIPVHKCVLSVRSPVFASMLHLDMEEKERNSIDIPDCSSGSFRVFLLYLYTSRTTKISAENVFDVYYAADKYQVDDLKEHCSHFMKSILSVDTFCDIIALSLCHSELALQKAATRFFCKNVKKIIKTARWQAYLKSNPTEANELYIKAIKA